MSLGISSENRLTRKIETAKSDQKRFLGWQNYSAGGGPVSMGGRCVSLLAFTQRPAGCAAPPQPHSWAGLTLSLLRLFRLAIAILRRRHIAVASCLLARRLCRCRRSLPRKPRSIAAWRRLAWRPWASAGCEPCSRDVGKPLPSSVLAVVTAIPVLTMNCMLPHLLCLRT